MTGDPANGSYHPPVTTNAMPAHEPGTKPARALPYQPNANLDGFVVGGNGSVRALLSFSNNGSHVRRASHFSVYDNAAPAATIAGDPALLPGQYTVDPSRSSRTPDVTGSVQIGAGRGDGRYDLTVVGPNRFLRRFTGDINRSGRAARVRASYGEADFDAHPRLTLELINSGTAAITFTVTPNAYQTDRARAYQVPAHGRVTHLVDPLARSHGWYDLSVTLGDDATWSQRYTGHLEDGEDSITG